MSGGCRVEDEAMAGGWRIDVRYMPDRYRHMPDGCGVDVGGPEHPPHGMRASLAMWTILAPGRASDTFSS
ncbi:hypothetical protein ACVW19_003872 [Streptomyces sp. TE5632]